ncbi:MAG: histidinol dehydrogenase [Proteobacteria bacterium]|nr:MAG: histidinol dehydrogenase [Pseudomonadota bacterium]
MQIFSTEDKDFQAQMDILLKRGHMDMDGVGEKVKSIIKEIKQEGNKALRRHIGMFDGWEPSCDEALHVDTLLMQKAYETLDADLKKALHLAYDRIYQYHKMQLPKSWMKYEKNGSMIGQKVTPMQRAGLYIPGGKAAYPSSLLMNAIPAIVAGVEEIIVCTPAPQNELNHLLLAAMHICGIKKAYKVGGASAIAALAYGTKSIPKVDVITGPGNIFVATAKKMVFGEVNIDMIAGPSEIGIIADESANARYLALDLLSQAEHDEMASSILVCTDKNLGEKVRVELEKILPTLDREKIARISIENRGAIIYAKNIDEAFEIMNSLAPEHLEIMTKNPFEHLSKIKNAGAIFLGKNTPEPIGDYIAGPNHTLPTGGTARFYSPLNVEHFMKKSSIIFMSDDGINQIGKECATLANCEGLTAHERSVGERLK